MKSEKRIAVIVGGFFTSWQIYRPLKQLLVSKAGIQTYIVPLVMTDWARGALALGRFGPLLRLIGETVDQAVEESGAQKVTLVAHSLGGVLSRLYLGACTPTPTPIKPYIDMRFDGPALHRVDELITLGTPHSSHREETTGFGALAFANRYYPGTFNPDVRYIAVAGKLVKGEAQGTLTQRRVYAAYRGIYGRGDVWGDELIPVESALLPGAEHCIVPNIRHAPSIGIAGAVWYGAHSGVVSQWWPHSLQQQALAS